MKDICDRRTAGRSASSCDEQPAASGVADNEDDCDDSDGDVKPGASEICDGRQNDCDKWADDGNVVSIAHTCK